MKKDLISLSFLLPQLKGINYTNVDKLGKNNVSLIISRIEEIIKFITTSIEVAKRNHALLRLPTNSLSKEINQGIIFNNMKCKHRQDVCDWLSELNDLENLPELSSLRALDYTAGDEVVIFIKPKNISRDIHVDCWRGAKFLKSGGKSITTTTAFSTEGDYDGCYLGNLDRKQNVIVRGDEYHQLKKLLENNKNEEFTDLWFLNCFHKKEDIKKLFLTKDYVA